MSVPFDSFAPIEPVRSSCSIPRRRHPRHRYAVATAVDPERISAFRREPAGSAARRAARRRGGVCARRRPATACSASDERNAAVRHALDTLGITSGRRYRVGAGRARLVRRRLGRHRHRSAASSRPTWFGGRATVTHTGEYRRGGRGGGSGSLARIGSTSWYPRAGGAWLRQGDRGLQRTGLRNQTLTGGPRVVYIAALRHDWIDGDR